MECNLCGNRRKLICDACTRKGEPYTRYNEHDAGKLTSRKHSEHIANSSRDIMHHFPAAQPRRQLIYRTALMHEDGGTLRSLNCMTGWLSFRGRLPLSSKKRCKVSSEHTEATAADSLNREGASEKQTIASRHKACQPHGCSASSSHFSDSYCKAPKEPR